MAKKIFKTTEEITKHFINNGWTKSTSFTELTKEEAEKKGYWFALNGMAKGRKYFVMNVTGNIFDDRGEIAMYNVKVSTR